MGMCPFIKQYPFMDGAHEARPVRLLPTYSNTTRHNGNQVCVRVDIVRILRRRFNFVDAIIVGPITKALALTNDRMDGGL